MPARTALAPAPEPAASAPVPELFPIEHVDWRRGRRVLMRAGLLALPVALVFAVQTGALTWTQLGAALVLAVFWAAVAAVALMVIVILATIIVKVMRSVRGVGRWLIR